MSPCYCGHDIYGRGDIESFQGYLPQPIPGMSSSIPLHQVFTSGERPIASRFIVRLKCNRWGVDLVCAESVCQTLVSSIFQVSCLNIVIFPSPIYTIPQKQFLLILIMLQDGGEVISCKTCKTKIGLCMGIPDV